MDLTAQQSNSLLLYFFVENNKATIEEKVVHCIWMIPVMSLSRGLKFYLITNVNQVLDFKMEPYYKPFCVATEE
jgi:hypothetical protein